MTDPLTSQQTSPEQREQTAPLAQTVEQLRLANEGLTAMQAAAEQAALLSRNLRALDFDEIVTIIASEVPRLFGAKWSVLSLPAGDSDVLSIRPVNCRCPQAAMAQRPDLAEALACGQTRCGQPPAACQTAGAAGCAVIVPLFIRGAAPEGQGFVQRAYLCMCHLDAALGDNARLASYKAELVQEVLSANLTNARLYQQLRRQRQVDLLTGLATRHILETRLGEEVQRSLRNGRPFSLAVLDIDGFRRINDAHGHQVGDLVLQQLAHALSTQTRKVDLVARYGGDEFSVLMPETNLSQAAVAAERIRQAAMAIALPDGSPLMISVGLAQWTDQVGPHPSELVRLAEVALFAAKRQGRTCAQAAGEPVPVR